MPCRDDRDSCQTVYREGHDPHYQELCQQLQARNNMLATLLCAVGRARKYQTDIPPEVIAWWRQHCMEDAARGEPW